MVQEVKVYKAEYTHELPGSDEFGKFSEEIAWLLGKDQQDIEEQVKKLPGINFLIKATALDGKYIDHKLTNAQIMARNFPDTFEAPDLARLSTVPPGDYVKICLDSERFWAEVVVNTGGIFLAEVNNDLICTDEHGLKLGDKIVFSHDKVYAIYSELFGEK
jgi:hypothetical protein